MLSAKEQEFVTYWEKEREKQSKMSAKLLSGLPMAFLFCLPVLLLVAATYFYLPEWYYRISNSISGSFVTIIIALFICIIFYAYFRMHYKWETNEQVYRELKSKLNKGNN